MAPLEGTALSGLEAPTRFELVNGGFANLCLTTWLRRRRLQFVAPIGAIVTERNGRPGWRATRRVVGSLT